MPASSSSLLLSVPDLGEAWGTWGANFDDFASLHYLHIWGYILSVPKMKWLNKWWNKGSLNLMQETMSFFSSACRVSCTAGSPAGEWQNGFVGCWEGVGLLRSEFWCFPSASYYCSNTSLPCLACASYCWMVSAHAASLPSAKPDAPLQDSSAAFSRWHWRYDQRVCSFSFGLCQGNSSTWSKHWLLQDMKLWKVGVVLERKNMCAGSKKGCCLRPLADWKCACCHEVTNEFWRQFFTHIWGML